MKVYDIEGKRTKMVHDKSKWKVVDGDKILYEGTRKNWAVKYIRKNWSKLR